MPDDTKPASSGRSQAAAGGLLAGAGLSTGLFGTIGMAKIFSAPSGYSTAYPVVVFCLAALFLLTAAVMTVQITSEQRRFAYAGIGCFALVAVVGVAIIFWQDFRAPTVTVTEMFEPSDLVGGSSNPAKLQLLYRSMSNAPGDFAPYRNSPLSIRSGDVIAFRMEGLADLVQNAKSLRDHSDIQTRLLLGACKSAPTSPVCQQLTTLETPD